MTTLRPLMAAAAAAATAVTARAWRQIPGVPGYLVSPCGSIKNAQTHRELRQTTLSTGYRTVGLRGRTVTVHRVVAMAWIPNPSAKATVNHRDRDRANNSVRNLEWATGSEQNRDRGAWKRLPALAGAADLPGEAWREVGGGSRKVVEVSSMGRIRRDGKVIQYTQRGEPYITVHVDGTRHKLHRLVAALFVPNPERVNVVNHIDGDTRNNAASNLEWCTQSENILHAHAMMQQRRAQRPVDQLDLDTGRLIRRFESRAEASLATGMDVSQISTAMRGRSREAGGYGWRDVYDSDSSSSSSDSD